jgi:predicted dienelactone hydrolase
VIRGEKHAMKKHLLASLLALAAACVQAAVGITELPATDTQGRITVFYPATGIDSAIRRGPFTIKAVPDAPAARGNGRLVVISHGSGGNAWVHSDLARALVEDGFVVAMPEHHADNLRDPSEPGPASWKRRPREVSRTIDALASDGRFAPLLSLDKVGMYGMSAGGHTALSLAGGRWSPALMRQHCDKNIAEDFQSCVGLATQLRGNFLDGVKKTIALGVIRSRMDDTTWYTHADPRVAAVAAAVPYAVDFDPASLAEPRVPLGLVTVGQDKWLPARFHSDRILAACRSCQLIAHLPTAGHGALLSPPPPLDRLNDIAADLLADPPGFDRSVLPEVDRKITSFMRRHLLP